MTFILHLVSEIGYIEEDTEPAREKVARWNRWEHP